jgi:thiamine-phosphate diphosphorylase
MKRDFSSVRLCVLVADGVSALPFEKLVSEVVAGGADCVQLREKGVADSVLLERASICRRACDKAGAIFIVNDRPDIAVLSEADGVHVGQSDLPAAAARRIMGPYAILGVSATNLCELTAAERSGADYVGIGAVFPTATKDIEAKGLEFVREAARIATRPLLAIGGINDSNVGAVILAGATGVAVFSAVVSADDPRSATRRLADTIDRALAERSKP